MTTPFLSREQSFSQLTEQVWDLVVIGGGATGCGTALDAASRGLKTLLLEKSDFASGTSGKSTKLIHGGLRYLKNMEFALVREVGKERAILQRNARHLVSRDPMFLPVYKNGELGWTTTAIALWVYEWLAGVESSEGRVMLNVKDTLSHIPLLNTLGLKGSAKYFEYRTDDARLTLALALTAQQHGATVLNYTSVEGFQYAQEASAINGLVVKDVLNGKEYEIQARCVVNAAGPWVDKIAALDIKTKEGTKLAGSRGIHIVLSRNDFPLKHAVYFDAPDGRMVFAIPREGMVYVGTTDVFYNGSLENPLIPREEIEYLIACVKAKFSLEQLSFDHVLSAWSGVRPLVKEQGKAEGKISRKDELYVSPSGLVNIMGGKLTGYRKMAQRTVDQVLRQLKRKPVKCRTEKLLLHGGVFDADAKFEAFVSTQTKALISALTIQAEEADWLVRRYGDKTNDFLSKLPQAGYYARKHGVSLSFASQIVYAIEEEMAFKADDVYVRRTSDFYFRLPQLKQHYKALIAIMAEHLSLDDRWIRKQEEEFKALCVMFNGSSV